MIKSIQLQDFKGHQNNTISLGRLTVLVGANGSGKTSVLDALRLQSQLVDKSFQQVMRGDCLVGDLLRRGSKGPISLTLCGESDVSSWSFGIDLLASTLTFHWKHLSESRTQRLPMSRAIRHEMPALAEVLKSAIVYKLSAARVAAAAYSDLPGPKIEHDGTNAAVALAALKLGDDERFVAIEESIRRIIPSVERVRIRQAVVQRPNPAMPGRDDGVLGNKVALGEPSAIRRLTAAGIDGARPRGGVACSLAYKSSSQMTGYPSFGRKVHLPERPDPSIGRKVHLPEHGVPVVQENHPPPRAGPAAKTEPAPSPEDRSRHSLTRSEPPA